MVNSEEFPNEHGISSSFVKTLKIVPRILVQPSQSRNGELGLIYSLLNLNLKHSLPWSPVHKRDQSMLTIYTHYLTTPQCIIHSYPTLIVVEWCKTEISASNPSQ